MLGSDTGLKLMLRVAGLMVGNMVAAAVVSMLVILMLFYLWKLKALGAAL